MRFGQRSFRARGDLPKASVLRMFFFLPKYVGNCPQMMRVFVFCPGELDIASSKLKKFRETKL